MNSFFKINYYFILSFSLIFIIHYFLVGYIFPFDYFRSEDLTYFFLESRMQGFDSLFKPIIGHYFSLQRVLAYIVSFFPVYYTPKTYVLLSILLSSLSLSIFSLRGFRWIVQNDCLRVLLTITFSLTHGASDVIYNLCSLYYVFVCAEIFLLLEKDRLGDWKINNVKIILLTILFLSAANSIIISPLLIYLFYCTKKNKYLTTLAILFLTSFVNYLAVLNDDISSSAQWEFIFLIKTYVLSFSFRFFWIALLGNLGFDFTQNIDLSLQIIIYSLGLGLFVALIKRIWNRDVGVLVLVLLSVNLFSVLLFMVRAYALDSMFENIYLRHSYMYAVFGLLFLAHIYSKHLSFKCNYKITRYFICSWLICFSMGRPIRHFIKADLLDKPSWKEMAPQIASALNLKKEGRLNSSMQFRLYNIRDPSNSSIDIEIAP